MRFIDEKGRLFGLVNIFDLFVLFLIIAATVFPYKWIKLADDPSWVKVETMHVKCEAISTVPAYIADSIKEGDVVVGDDGAILVTIQKIIKVEPMEIKINVSTGLNEEELFFDKNNKKMTLLLDVLCYKRKNAVYTYIAHSPMLAGSGFVMNTKKYSLIINIAKVLN